MIQITYPAPRLSLEDEARQLGQRYSRTSAEREAIAADAHDLLTRYELQGGKFGTKWLERHMGVNHPSAVNIRRAGLALSRAALQGIGVSKLATVGRALEQGQSLIQGLMLLDNAEARKQAADAANIGVASVKYSAGMTGDMAAAYTAAVNTYDQAGLSAPELPELTVALVKLGAQASPDALRRMELGETEQQQADQKVKSDLFPQPFYSWLARQPCAVCQMPGVEIHHVRAFDLPDQVGGRRFKYAKGKELVIPLCGRHHQGAVDAAHAGGQDAWSTRHFGRPDAVYLLSARYLSTWAEENHMLRGN